MRTMHNIMVQPLASALQLALLVLLGATTAAIATGGRTDGPLLLQGEGSYKSTDDNHKVKHYRPKTRHAARRQGTRPMYGLPPQVENAVD